ncbi:GDP-fucose synthetase [Candidatus Roizmanbacteria bacterium RIFOXYB2_FULL_38_10]|uniref:GDP-L-fucose synthase n=1 Tax=Candidatus Roizmanbacteria bacterium RIFOXYD1_FULL_38_12 TaxID=1802093 RepID=A0A1F7L0U5_9BACT|nr:MAG: GDP-fucose synthetase [Candidatus Roizmanbacteria bacterium RIFOXYA2_FULL_38_14]OGK63757.1 MAG: GDP-fucose synthetase [Candidatus Roizmanbacteria bacterium RIFOXYA1_FULL_37_12]OGK65603.1 MAG: GDP-fucose synthetase [Candidatus Roizmanbacteria bacterium RIFOXYB1_FULL_40_23]OGK67509.1 MAG: GDP-fucose synthetase [Candidatus Roizmanbacteria bacterium RIFOXYB2_FULL_38_10]OGK70008.1 MAG: GDP-fucose synthetase [Candidatus Roizmanbacteria bacterium RIFOXYC1_FULL_38_14]OGK71311.1 MAG: GDP-fucose
MNNFFYKKKILLTGGAGFVGTYVCKELVKQGAKLSDIIIPRSHKFDLREADICNKLTKGVDIVINLAGNVGGIGYNRENPGALFYDNITMGVNLIEASRINKVKKFVQIGTICSYPKYTPVPFKEENLWNGYPEETNAPYGIAKKALLVMMQAYKRQYNFRGIYLLPVNMYGPGDNFDPKSSHVIAALIRKIYEAKRNGKKEIIVWGDGSATREFFYVEDAALAIVKATAKYEKTEPVNIGAGFEIRIDELVGMLVKLMAFEGDIVWDRSKPNGQPRRSLDTSKAKKEFGFKAKTPFNEGLKKTVEWYYQNPFV